MRFALQAAPLGTVHAVLSASDHVVGAPYGVGNADDVYGRAGCTLLAQHLRAQTQANALVGYRLADAVIGFSPVTRGVCRVTDDGRLAGIDERRQVRATPDGGFEAGDGREPSFLSPEARVSMNLWGFTPAFHSRSQSGHGRRRPTRPRSPRSCSPTWSPDHSPPRGSTSCLLTAGASGSRTPMTSLWSKTSSTGRSRPASERPVSGPRWAEGLTAAEEGPAMAREGPPEKIGQARRLRLPAPDATQPRVTVRPKPPVLLGVTSAMPRWRRAGVVSDNPRPGRPDDSREAAVAHHGPSQYRDSRPLRSRSPLRGSLPSLDPAFQRSLGFRPVHLAAPLRASLAHTLRCSLEVRWALVSELRNRLHFSLPKVNG